MHPLAAIGLVFLAGLAWMGTILTLLIALAKARHLRPTDGGPTNQENVELHKSEDTQELLSPRLGSALGPSPYARHLIRSGC